MNEGFMSFNLYELLTLCLFFAIGIFVSIFFLKPFITRSITEILHKELHNYELLYEKILSKYSENVLDLFSEIQKIKEETVNNFTVINHNIDELNNLLAHLKAHLIQVDELENKIIKYKKIIKRLEKKS